ncbi:MAG: TetR/AcrR family transcriptional regulator; helix-turn-helix transcriptional regulator, partial [Deltaproteobacteria bacterium]|nr:TetR/AcrR family transcriptional regulator; helix-turn-helix transcriptional regulator [Deltaproteobacteria bacterium]
MTVAQRRRREREQRRAQILDAAQAVFTERGLAASTMEQVAAAAEVSKGTLYLYFRSKDELFMALASEVAEATHAAIEDVAADGKLAGLECLRGMARAAARVALEHPNTVRNMVIWMASGDACDIESDGFKHYRERVDKVHALMLQALRDGQEDGSIRRDLDLVTTLSQIWPSMMISVVATVNLDEVKRRIQKDIDGELLTPGLTDLLIRGIAANPAP